jgi:hypothetical protein|tara:strand:- start:7733 stop:8524 length:792 start_codon:yes stop_codon:yes gene_type:complete
MNWGQLKKGITGGIYVYFKDIAERMRSSKASVEMEVDGEKITKEQEEEELFENAQSFDVTWKLPDNIDDLNFAEGATPEEIGAMIASAQSTQPEDEIDDNWLDYISKYPALQAPPSLPALPENLQRGWYPKEVKPNIKAIKQWVLNVKLAGASDEELVEEYYRDRERPNTFRDKNWTRKTDAIKMNKYNMPTIRDNVVDSIAFKVARKIWYVGRRPTTMTDEEWDAHTKYRRAEEGSFGKNDHWVKFKYDVNYKYQSGVDEDI